MILILIALLIIACLTAYLTSQGFLSATLELAAAAFASVFAVGFFEVLAPILDRWRPDISRGMAFLLLFLIVFGVLRITFDLAVPKTIKLEIWINRIAGGIIGFFASLIIVGTALTGIALLPLGEKTVPMAFPAPFANALFYATSGHALGGTPLASVHPDLTAELTDNRHTVVALARQSLSPDLIKAEAWTFADPPRIKAIGLSPEPDKKILIVRTSIAKGSAAPHLSFDPTNSGNQVLITPQQVRLVVQTTAGGYRQYHPIGHLRGEKYENFLDADHHLRSDVYLAEDSGDAPVLHDWVFELDDEATAPRWIEIKAGGRAALAEGQTKIAPLTLRQIPRRASERDYGSIKVTVQFQGNPVAGAQFIIIPPLVHHRDVNSLISSTFDDLDSHIGKWKAGEDGWGKALNDQPGVPHDNELNLFIEKARIWRNSVMDENLDWAQLITGAFKAHQGVDGRANLAAAPRFFEDILKPLLRSTGSYSERPTDAQGTFYPISAAPGSYLFLVIANGDKYFVAATIPLTLKANQNYTGTVELTKPDIANYFSIIFPPSP